MNWTRDEAVRLCILVESIAPAFGCHVALTGGTLYKPGPRKDCDLLFYRIRQAPAIDQAGLFAALRDVGLEHVSGEPEHWCHKATFLGKPLDLFFPDVDAGDYETGGAS